jgi:hypothetical protein
MNRRTWIGTALATPAALAAPQSRPGSPGAGRKKIGCVVTVYRYNSHADVLCGRLLAGYSPNGVWERARNHVVSLHAEQVPANDMSRDLAARNGFRLSPTIREALTLGGSSLAVDAVVFVGEHGEYPTNELGQILYPRYELFNQIMDVYEQSGRSVPTFFDKHLSYSWEKADAIYKRARKIGFPFMAGSSIPFTLRNPPLDPPLGTPITEAIGIGYGPSDAYGFHSIEALQCLVERRKGGETGIQSVEWIAGDAIWAWRDSERGSWSKPLLQEALRLQPDYKGQTLEELAKKPVLFVLNYADGTKGAVLMLSETTGGWSAALRVAGQERIQATSMSLATKRPLPNWDGLVRCVDLFLTDGKPWAPVERTLLVTGALAFCFQSKGAGKLIETPQLNIKYHGPAKSWFQTA